MKSWIKIHQEDNVLIALNPLEKGTEIIIDDIHIFLPQQIDKGHKLATRTIKAGEHVIKYGSAIGHATCEVAAGEWIHSHNLKTNLSDELEYQYLPQLNRMPESTNDINVEIYLRNNGEVGIRNELWIIPTVGCVNGVAKQLVQAFQQEHDCSGIDGIHYFPHQFGCSQLGDDHKSTRQLLQNMALHPNAGGVLIIGLGCENNQVQLFKETLGDYDESRIRFMTCQEVEDELRTGSVILQELYAQMKDDKRQIGKLSDIRFGLECGGSDGLSGITANPLLGRLSDTITGQGGTTVLTEVPEMFGAETLLMNRADDTQVFDQIVHMVNSFKRYYIDHNQPVYENPSPGNKKGGITTLEEKSLGCVQKAGQREVKTVLGYGDRITTDGLTLLNAPGNDAIATSALAAAGCHLVLFTTGRGTPYGGFVPTFKVSTNSLLAEKKPKWIDFDAGMLVSTDTSMDQLHNQLLEELVSTINGKKTHNEVNDIRELAVWKNGVTL